MTAAPVPEVGGSVLRYARPADAGPLLDLMTQLAAFERYPLAVTERDLVERGLAPAGARQFTAIVAEAAAGALAGYAVVHEVPFTYDLRPSLILKELYVDERVRGAGVGRAIMTAVLGHARAMGCGRVKWDVLPDNTRAQAFYRRLGGRPELAWQPWILDLAPERAP